MTDATANIPQSLKDALREGRIVPFVGAGVSMAVRKKALDGAVATEPLFPSWKGLVNILAVKLRGEGKSVDADHIETSIKLAKPKYLEALQHAQEELNNYLWYQTFSEQFDVPESRADADSLALPKAIWQLSRNLIITTNIERVLQWTAPTPADCKVLDVQHAEYALLQQEQFPARPTVWHLHGHIDHKEKVVFTRAQFDAFYKQKDNEAKLHTLLNVLTNKSLLFIGFSLDDDYLREVIENVQRIYAGATPTLYILFRAQDIATAKLPAYVTPVPFADFGAPLLELVRELARIANGEVDHDNDGTGGSGTGGGTTNPNRGQAFFNVPYPSKGAEFVGRTGKLKEIQGLLNQSGCAAIGQAVSVRGFGGLGKTQLAVEYAQAYRDCYRHGVFWLVADGSLDTQLLQIADKLKWVTTHDQTVNQIEVAREQFRKLSECLILCDNVEDYADISAYLPSADATTHILITSREPQPKFRQIGLELLHRDEARSLLLQVARRTPPGEAESGELKNILEMLGDIPLAVELVGGYLAEHENVTFARYRQFLDEEPLDRLEAEFPAGSFTNHDRSIIRTLRISEKQAADKPLMAAILHALAYSGKATMGDSLLQAMLKPDSDFAFYTALGDAIKLRFVKKDETAGRYAIHRLLAKVIRHDNPLDKEPERLRQLATNLKDWFEKHKEEFDHLATLEAEAEHLREWQTTTRQISPELFVNLLALESYPFWQRGNYQKSFFLLAESYQLYQTENLTNLQLLARIENDLGAIHNTLGHHTEALTHTRQALEIRRTVLGEQHLDTALSLNNVGGAYAALGHREEALNYTRRALEIRRTILGELHPDTASSLNNVGTVYGALGNHKEALNYKLQALEIQRTVLGKHQPKTAMSLNSVGATYGALGRYMEALAHQQQALEIYREVLGELHPDTAKSLNSVGATYGALGRHVEALAHQQQALEIHRQLLGESHPNTITFAANLITTYLNLGRKESAWRLAGDFLPHVPPTHPQRQFFETQGRSFTKRKKPRWGK